MKKRALFGVVIALFPCMAVTEVYATTTIAVEDSSPAKTITLFENTTILGETGQTIGIIAPQTVAILDNSQRRVGHGEGYLVPIYLISTWLGNAWIMPNNALLGNQKSVDTRLEIFGVESLYSDPGLTKPTGMQLAPQTVKVKAEWDSRYLIETLNGERWVSPRYTALFEVKEVRQEVQLKNTTKLFRSPDGMETGSNLSPQMVTVNEVWQDWCRIDSWLGPVWIELKRDE